MTTKEWLKTLPQPYRKEALMNCKDSKLSMESGTLCGAINNFNWLHTKQGNNYWNDLYVRAARGEFTNSLFKIGDIVTTHIFKDSNVSCNGSMRALHGRHGLVTEIHRHGYVVHGYTWIESSLTKVREM